MSDVTAYNRPPYFDDFNVADTAQNGKNAFTKNYHRILFQPTNAVQTRELNQLQTMLQNQIAQLSISQINASAGGAVINGIASIDDVDVTYMDVNFDNPLTQSVENVYENIKFIESRKWDGAAWVTDLTAEVLSIKPKPNSNQYRIWFRYQNLGGVPAPGNAGTKKHFLSTDIVFIKDNIIPDAAAEEIIIEAGDPLISTIPQAYEDFDTENSGAPIEEGYYGIATIIPKYDPEAPTVEISPVGFGVVLNVEEGVYLIKGCLVHTFPQTYYYILKNERETFDGHASFLIEETITTVEQDPTLRDNANGTFNYAAPGADRYTIKLTLALNTKDPEMISLNDGINPIFDPTLPEYASVTYINLFEILQNKRKVESDPQTISDELLAREAKRTREESGSYTVSPFLISPREFLNDGGNGGRFTIEEILQNNPKNPGSDKGIKELYIDEGGADLTGYDETYADPLLYPPTSPEGVAVQDFKDWVEGKMAIDIDPSTAYVDGFRVALVAPQTVRIDKARETTESIDVNVSMPRGNYVDLVLDPALLGPEHIDNFFNVPGRGTQIKNIEFRGPVTQADLDNGRYPDQYAPSGSQEGFLKIRLYVYNNYDTSDPVNGAGTALTDLPKEFQYKILESSIVGGNFIEDRTLKYPKQDYSIFALKYPAIKDVTRVEYVVQEVIQFAETGPTTGIWQGTVSDPTYRDFESGIGGTDILVYNQTEGWYVDSVSETVAFNLVDEDTLNITFDVSDDPGRVNHGDILKIIVPVTVSDNEGHYLKQKNHLSFAGDVTASCYTQKTTLHLENSNLGDQDIILSSLKVYESSTNLTPIAYTVIDDGYGKNFYDNPVLKLDIPQDVQGMSRTVYVEYDYFQHTAGEYFVAQSYPENNDFGYADIPKYGNAHLSDFADFRTKRNKLYDFTADDGSFTYTITGPAPVNILPNSVGEFDIEHYMSRIDLLGLTTGGDMIVTRGNADLDPFPKKGPAGSLTMYHLNLNPYTYGSTDVKKGYIDNNRYTMRDIGRLEKRVANLEYYSSLSLLEKEAQDRKILDLSSTTPGVERFKNGTLVDSFVGHNVGDISNPDYAAAVNTQKKTMGPSFAVDAFRMKYTGLVNPPTGALENFGSVTNMSGAVPTLFNESGSTIDGLTHFNVPKISPITEGVDPGFAGIQVLSLWKGKREILYENLLASETISVQPYEVTTWLGRITLSPSSDEWIDTERLPPFAVDFSSFENYFEDVATYIVDLYGTDETVLSTTLVGRSTSSSSSTVRAGGRMRTTSSTRTTNTFEQETLVEWLTTDVSNISIDFGDRVVDTSIIPWIRSRDVEFQCFGFKPNTELYAFFDKQEVTAYCAPTTSFEPFAYTTGVATYNGQDPSSWGGAFTSPIFTDENGTCTGVFRIPNNQEYAFRTGNREFKLIDNAFNNEVEADTYGTTQYHANGLVQEKESSSASVRVPTIDYNSRIDNSTFDTTSTRTSVNVWDPIAQTFFIGPEYPNGLFLSDIDIYFATVPEDPNICVTAYLVTTENGTPTTTILPGSEVTYRAGDIPANQITGRYLIEGSVDEIDFGQVASDPLTNHPTRFTFDFPVYLKGGEEYALVIFGLSPEFRVWTSLLSGVDLVTNQVITRNPAFGVFQQSQNKRTWTPDQYRDLTCRLHKAVFPVNETYEYRFSTYIPSDDEYPLPAASLNSVAGSFNGFDAYDHTFFQLYMKSFEVNSTTLDFEVNYVDSGQDVKNNEGDYVVEAGQEVYLPGQISTASALHADARLFTSDRNVSPVIDCETGSVQIRSNIINDLTTGEGSEYNFSTNEWVPAIGQAPTGGGDAAARYITQKVELNNASEDLRVVLSVNRPSSKANIHVYAKRKKTEEFQRSAEEVGWYKMATYSVAGDTNSSILPINQLEDDYTEIEYILPNPDPTVAAQDPIPPISIDPASAGFTEFIIKVVFTSRDKAQVCKIKNMTAIASI
jgi:hypothetical protein